MGTRNEESRLLAAISELIDEMEVLSGDFESVVREAEALGRKLTAGEHRGTNAI
jgi:hypothetical protein